MTGMTGRRRAIPMEPEGNARPLREAPAENLPAGEDLPSGKAVGELIEPDSGAHLRDVQTHEPAPARRLITANLRLVVKIAQEYRRAHRNLLDLIQEGNVGLIQAVQRRLETELGDSIGDGPAVDSRT